GGMSGRDMETIAQGLCETTEFPYLQNRIGQVNLLHGMLDKLGVPLVKPAGGHAVYLDAREYLKNVSEEEYRADTLACLVYGIGGIRTSAIGNMMYAEKDSQGRILEPSKNDFLRLAIPRNVYMLEHILFVANTFQKIHKVKDELEHGIEVAGKFRNDRFDHFDCKLRPVDEKNFERVVKTA
ncbi:MAG: tyrosine phenol-lyase, partial [Candidatus Micrarchaeota archaeon]